MVYTAYDEDHPNNKISIMGNPTLGEIKTMVIGVRNVSGEIKSGEVWVNELRLKEYDNKGGWAAQGTLNVQLSLMLVRSMPWASTCPMVLEA